MIKMPKKRRLNYQIDQIGKHKEKAKFLYWKKCENIRGLLL